MNEMGQNAVKYMCVGVCVFLEHIEFVRDFVWEMGWCHFTTCAS